MTGWIQVEASEGRAVKSYSSCKQGAWFLFSRQPVTNLFFNCMHDRIVRKKCGWMKEDVVTQKDVYEA